MSKAINRRLFDGVLFWTAVTSIFAWLPLVRIIGRPDGYTWGILGLSGAGREGPWWIFVLLTIYVVTMLFCTFRGPRTLLYSMLVLWHLTVAGVVIASVALGGSGAVFQGQGLHFAIPMWILMVPFVLFAVATFTWIVLDARAGGAPERVGWNRTNTGWLLGSLALLGVALTLFRAGTNYNWVTAAAIITTILHWGMLIRSFEPAGEKRFGPAGPMTI